MRTAKPRSLAALALVACLLATGCGRKAAGPAAAPAPSPEAAAQAAKTTSPAAGSTRAASTSSAPTSAASSRVGGTASAYAIPLLSPIATLPAPKPAKRITAPRDLGVAVLMYHVIGTAPAGARNPDLYVAPSEFVAQMGYLSSHGYHAVTLQQVYDFWRGTSYLPSKPIVLSFDDGDTPDFTIAAPLLNELHWPGTLNLIVGRKSLRFKPGIVRALIAAGWEIDSHTMTHEDVPGLSARELRYQVGQSRIALQQLYGVPVNFFCYPSGRFDANAIAAVKAAGYLGATTTLGGLARPSDPYVLRRVRVSGGRSVGAFAALIADAR